MIMNKQQSVTNRRGDEGVKGAKSDEGVKSAKGAAAESFEDLHVYQRARELTNAIYEVTREGSFAHDRSLVDQIRRAAASIMSNIAEGFERGSKTELIQFLFIAKGSCGEVRAQLQIAADQQYMSPPSYQRLHALSRMTSGMLSNFIAHLQKSDYQGEKIARPQRLGVQAHQARLNALRAAQEANMRSQQLRESRDSTLHEQNDPRGHFPD
jgi:four helix bundle protein